MGKASKQPVNNENTRWVETDLIASAHCASSQLSCVCDPSSSRFNFTSCKVETITFGLKCTEEMSRSIENVGYQRGSLHGGFSYYP